MSDVRSWIVGASPASDLVVDHPTVSGRHCRISDTPQGILLEDLGSTNGTYVDGQRLAEPRIVTRKNAITLGQTIPLPWPREIPEEPRVAEERIIRIGRSPDNDVVLDSPAVSGHHARIIVAGDRIEIEDLDSTNGTSLNAPGRTIRRTRLAPSDTVYFGTYAVPASRLLGGDGIESTVLVSGPVATPFLPSASPTPLSRHPALIAGLAAAGLVAVLLISVVGWLVTRGPASSPAETNLAAGNSAVPPAATGQKSASSDPTPTVAPTLPDAALYTVIVSSADGLQRFRLGTAWADGERRLMTTAAIAALVEDLRKEFPTAMIVSADGNSEYKIVRAVPHPEFRVAFAESNRARAEAERLRAKLEAEDESKTLSDEDLDKLVQQVVDAEEKRFLATEKQALVDLGVLGIAESLPSRLTAVESAKLSIGQRIEIAGLPFDSNDVLAGIEGATPVAHMKGIVQKSAGASTGGLAGDHRWIVRTGQNVLEQNWFGSPVRNQDGEIVGVLSRLTPPVDPTKPPSGDDVDIVPIQKASQLRALIR